MKLWELRLAGYAREHARRQGLSGSSGTRDSASVPLKNPPDGTGRGITAETGTNRPAVKGAAGAAGAAGTLYGIGPGVPASFTSSGGASPPRPILRLSPRASTWAAAGVLSRVVPLSWPSVRRPVLLGRSALAGASHAPFRAPAGRG